MTRPVRDDAHQSPHSRITASDSRFQIIFDAVNDGIFISDPATGRFIEVNEPGCRMFGYTRAELIGRDIVTLASGVYPYTQEVALQQLKQVASEGPQTFEWRAKTKDGALFWVEISLRFAEFGKIPAVVAIVRDSTARKQAEEQLQFANALLTAQLEGSPTGILVADKNRKIILFNRRFGELWRIPQDLIASGADEIVLKTGVPQLKDPEAFYARVMQLYDHPEEVGNEEIEFKDGRVFQRYSTSLHDASRGYLGRVWFFDDITARRQSETALKQERDFSTALIDSLPGLFVMLDEGGKIIRFNENLSTRTGLSDQQVRDLDAFALVVDSDRAAVRSELQQALARGTVDIEFGVNAKEGDVRIVRWSGQRIINEGRPGLVAVGMDVTDERETEARLRASEERFQAVSHTALDAIIISDSRGKVSYWNPAAERILGYSANEAIGRIIHEWLTPPRFREKAIAGMKEFAATGQGRVIGATLELAATRKDGAEIPIELSVSRMRLGADWNAVAMLRDVTVRKRTEEQMRHMARHDVLTGLVNRGTFVELVEQAIALERRDDGKFAVLYLDLDHFKDVNDTLGHPVGDQLLQLVAQRLRTTIREADTVSRFGGDEFALIAINISDPMDAAVLADKIVKAINEPFSIQGNEIRIGTSIGIAAYGPDAPDAETLLSNADLALYRAKSEGRGTYRFFTNAMDTEVRTRVALGTELREAIASRQLFLEYQPEVNVDTGRIVGLEALVRWRHPTLGLITADAFVAAAEKTGLIVPLGQWVLQAACRQMKDWRDGGIAPPLIAVNVSALQFKTPLELERDIATILAENALPPASLELELTETAFMETSQDHNDALIRLRKSGIRIAIDDFGTGYSSLGYLGRFPVDRIKIGQGFVLDLTPDSNNAKIVKAAIGLAHELGLDVIVEGVERAEQLALVKAWDCHKMQGFYFSRPLPAAEIATLLRARAILPAPPDLSRAIQQ